MKTVLMRHDVGGEGSRGGKVIGHTSGGKPIYASHGHPSHEKFNVKEHGQAQQIHTEARDKIRKKHGFSTKLKNIPDKADRTKAIHHRKQGLSHGVSAAELEHGAVRRSLDKTEAAHKENTRILIKAKGSDDRRAIHAASEEHRSTLLRVNDLKNRVSDRAITVSTLKGALQNVGKGSDTV